MTFLSPWFLLLLVPVAALAVAYVMQHRRRSRYAVRFATLPMLERLVPQNPGWRRHLPAAALLTALTLLALAVARPEMPLRVPREATIVVALDTSGSMQAVDVAPNRMDAAIDVASQFIEDLPDRLEVGLVSFETDATVRVSPTEDHDAVVRAMASLEARGGTAIGDALLASVDQLAAVIEVADDPSTATHVVLLSDGTNSQGAPVSQGVAAAIDAGVPVSTIAYGSDGADVTVDGQLLPADADVETMALIADDTGGTAYTAESDDELSSVYDDVEETVGWTTRDTEITHYVAALALLIGIGAAALSMRWFSRLT